MDSTTFWVLIFTTGLFLIALIVMIVLLMTDAEIIVDNDSSSSSCCADTYTDSDGNEHSVCEYQPYQHNADPSSTVDDTLTGADSFAQACANAGGTTAVTDTTGVRCACTCINPIRDLGAIVAPSGQYYESVARTSGNASIETTCPGYRD